MQLIILVTALTISLLTIAVRQVARFAQYLKNKAVKRLLSDPHRRNSYVLYLRAFDHDEVTQAAGLRTSLSGIFRGIAASAVVSRGTRFVRFIERTARATFDGLPMVGLAGPSEFFGVGQVKVDGYEWQSTVEGLCRDARAIVFVIGGSTGLSWELAHILGKGHWQKTVFVLPPWELMRRQYQVAAEVIVIRTKRIFESIGIALPKPNLRGRVFAVSDAKDVVFVRDIHSFWFLDKSLSEALTRVRSLSVA